MPRFINLVFRGGGVRGIAYAGALSRLPDDYVIKGLAGTSAGSIFAALLASIGRDSAKLRATLSDPKLFALINEVDLARTRRMLEAAREIKYVVQDVVDK